MSKNEAFRYVASAGCEASSASPLEFFAGVVSFQFVRSSTYAGTVGFAGVLVLTTEEYDDRATPFLSVTRTLA